MSLRFEGIDRTQYAREPWQHYTASPLGLAPPPLRHDGTAAAGPEETIPEAVLSESAAHLGKPEHEPLTWQPP